jgi:hypothetical protein
VESLKQDRVKHMTETHGYIESEKVAARHPGRRIRRFRFPVVIAMLVLVAICSRTGAPLLGQSASSAAACGYVFSTGSLAFSNLTNNQTGQDFTSSGSAPTREYIRLGGRVIAIANCGAQ